jgi:hypothetical protein
MAGGLRLEVGGLATLQVSLKPQTSNLKLKPKKCLIEYDKHLKLH